MRFLRFVLLLAGVVLLHSLGTEYFAWFPSRVDLFLVFAIAWAAESTTLTGLLAGLTAGLAADALSGGPYGLNGFADTVVGYGVALAVANLAKLNTVGVAVLYAAAASVQQAILVLLVVLLLPDPSLPSIEAVVWKIALTGLLGVVVFLGRRRLTGSLRQWRKSREDRLRF